MTQQGILTAADLAFIDGCIDGSKHNFLPDNCDIYAGSAVISDSGASSIAYSVAYGTEPCRVDQLSARYRDEYEHSNYQIDSIPELSITLRQTVQIKATDRILFRSRWYEVERALVDHSWPGFHFGHVRMINEGGDAMGVTP
jgi:hypothetical protein